MTTKADTPKKKRGMPTSYTILILCLLFVAVVTWICAATGTGVAAAKLSQIVGAPLYGFENAFQVCMFVMILGGFLAMVNKTGALDAGITALVHKMGGNEVKLIPVLMILLGICGSTYGMMEETVPFYILLASVTYAAGFDSMTGALIVLLGAGLGCLGSTVNPFSVGVASAALTDLGIAVDQGLIIGLGLLLLVVSEAMGIVFVMSYAKKVKRDRANSAMTADELAEADKAFGAEAAKVSSGDVPVLTGTQKTVLLLFALSFIVMIVSFIPWAKFGIDFFALGATAEDSSTAWSAFLTGVPLGDWYFMECAIWFFVMSIIIGAVGRLGEKEIVNTFIAGASDMVGTALVIAIARGVSVLMNQTGLDTWFLNAAANGLAGVPAAVFAPLTFALYFVLSFLIPSSSGMATLSMPIMGPLAAGLNFAPEVMIMIYVAAHGVVLMITPTNGVIVGGLELAKTSFASFLKLVTKFIALLTVVVVVILTIAMAVL